MSHLAKTECCRLDLFQAKAFGVGGQKPQHWRDRKIRLFPTPTLKTFLDPTRHTF